MSSITLRHSHVFNHDGELVTYRAGHLWLNVYSQHQDMVRSGALIGALGRSPWLPPASAFNGRRPKAPSRPCARAPNRIA